MWFNWAGRTGLGNGEARTRKGVPGQCQLQRVTTVLQVCQLLLAGTPLALAPSAALK